jgi:hypothetical protein
MPRFSPKQYQSRVLIAMGIYTAFMLFAWPLVHTTTSLPLKLLLATAPTLPVLYVIVQMARLILSGDELERHTHLVALSTATAVVSALSFIAGFLVAAGVIKLDGWILLLVYPAMVVCYALVRWRVMHSYGGNMQCDEELSIKPYLFMVLLGTVLLLVAAVLAGHESQPRLDDLNGVGCAFIAGGLLALLLRWLKRKNRHE